MNGKLKMVQSNSEIPFYWSLLIFLVGSPVCAPNCSHAIRDTVDNALTLDKYIICYKAFKNKIFL